MILRSGCSPSREYATGAAVESPETRNFTLQAQRSGPTWQVEMTESTDSQTEERSERRRNGEEATWLVDRCPRRAQRGRVSTVPAEANTPLFSTGRVCLRGHRTHSSARRRRARGQRN